MHHPIYNQRRALYMYMHPIFITLPLFVHLWYITCNPLYRMQLRNDGFQASPSRCPWPENGV